MRKTLRWLVLVGVVAVATGAGALEGPAEWLKRVLDPATLGIATFPGAQINRKLSTDAIGLERGGDKRIVVYLISLDQLGAAAEFYQKQFGVAPKTSGEGGQYLTYVYDFTGSGAPEKYKGLMVMITRSPFVDGKGQIRMDYQPPSAG